MTIFDLDRNVVEEYARFARSFTNIRADDLRLKLDAAYASNKFWPEPMIQLNPRFANGGTVAQLVASGDLERGTESIFRRDSPSGLASDQSLALHKHQLDAITLANSGKSFVVTTGTGSGKSLCYFLPIINRVLKAKAAGEPQRTRAIVIYPMNALANSQMEELGKRISGSGLEDKVTFERYTGQDDDETRQRVRQTAPDILLTNFMMLELLLTRQSETDRQVIKNCQGLEFLVLDELHTYRGRQGADVAMLVRRVRERLEIAERPILCVGTSATMASEGGLESRQTKVAEVASTLFATSIKAQSIVTETLERSTDKQLVPARILKSTLRSSVSDFNPQQASDTNLRANPFMAWIEMTLGLSVDEDGSRLSRAKPRDLRSAAKMLASDTGLPEATCRSQLELALQTAGRPGFERGESNDRPFFPVRLHRFISGAGRVHATLEPRGIREVTFDGQVFLPGREEPCRLYATYFCRTCGQEHHPVVLVKEGGDHTLIARSIDDIARTSDDNGSDRQEEIGFATPVTNEDMADFQGTFEEYPDDWTEITRSGELRLKTAYRDCQLVRYLVKPDGRIGVSGQTIWFQRGKFRFCAACKEAHGQAGRDINRLAGLTAEGRSSATTVLVSSVLQWMKQPENQKDQLRQKVLGFSDNRQDAALQAGHFNDFVFVSLLRGATLAALEQAGDKGLTDATVGRMLAQALGFTVENKNRQIEWLADREIESEHLIGDAASDLCSILSHRFWFDQRRGWRFTFPNLEQLGLIEVRYKGVDEFCNTDTKFAGDLAPLVALSTKSRADAFRVILDAARRGLAVRSDALSRGKLEDLQRRRLRLAAPWTFGENEIARDGGILVVGSPPETKSRIEEQSFVRSGVQSTLGKELRTVIGRKLKADEQKKLVLAMCVALKKLGLLVDVPLKNATAFRVAAESVSFHRANLETKGRNLYFASLYETLGHSLLCGGDLLFGDEAREHTAQVEHLKRQMREKRFRWGEKEQQELQRDSSVLRQLGEAQRFLPVMFCSPTMELGVDISELDAVYLRNVPPTPANYAQRSGRAGRGGSAALVLTYCSSQSPHDQYFFERREDMIQGVVRPPAIDLSNQDLVDSHLHAMWLAETGQPLGTTIAEVLDTGQPSRPLRSDISACMVSADLQTRSASQMARYLGKLANDLSDDCPEWLSAPAVYAEEASRKAPKKFDSAFVRWRELLASAEAQRDEARRTIDNFGITDPKLRRSAESLHNLALRQIGLLLAGRETVGSDFYTYRYLATEGFLPGYNFPRLPLLAFIPGQGTEKRQAYVQRPRFLGISEFGPHSRVYHEGRAYRVVRVQVPASELAQGGGKLLTETVWICMACGARDERQPECCHACDANEGWKPIIDVKRIENLSTKAAEQITANDEERQRQGFEIITTFAWSRRGGRWDTTNVEIREENSDLVAVAKYASAAKLQRLNLGLRRRKNKNETGYMIEPATGRWLNTDDAEDAASAAEDDPARGRPQRIVPMVEDHKNTLLVKPSQPFTDPIAAVTLQHALLRGLETEFQLEEGELLSEPMPGRDDRRALLFYEATEGGAGVLARLSREPDAVARVAKQALRVMHFNWTGEKPIADKLSDSGAATCVKGCYRCLLSYFNQPEHEKIDRHNVEAIEFLCRLANSSAGRVASKNAAGGVEPAQESLEKRFCSRLAQNGISNPKVKVSGEGWQLTWKENLVVALLGRTTADRRTLEDLEYRVFEVPLDDGRWPASVEAIKLALGVTN